MSPHVNRVANPVDARVVSNYFVHGINHDNLIVLVDRVLWMAKAYV